VQLNRKPIGDSYGRGNVMMYVNVQKSRRRKCTVNVLHYLKEGNRGIRKVINSRIAKIKAGEDKADDGTGRLEGAGG